MKAVILAGGLGTRLSEETAIRPKPMVEIGGKPILWHIMKMYSHHGINDFIVCCGYKGYGREVLPLVRQQLQAALTAGDADLAFVDDHPPASVVTLHAIAQEIRGFAGLLENESDLATNFPKLCEYLSGVQPVDDQIEDIGPDQALMFFAEKIRNLDMHQVPVVHAKADKNSQQSSIDDIIIQLNRESQIDDMAKRRTLRTKRPGVAGYHQAVEPDLREITSLASVLEKVPTVVEKFQEMKGWMLRAADLQSDETERMMKYQTMLERRLSSAIGELLELRKYRLN